MIKAKMNVDGKDVFVLGLSDEHLLRLQNGQAIQVSLDQMDGPPGVQVAITWGQTESHILRQLGLPVPAELLEEERHPRGKMRADDKGSGAFALSVRGSTLLMEFTRPITWLGFGPADVERLIRMLQEKLAKMTTAGA